MNVLALDTCFSACSVAVGTVESTSSAPHIAGSEHAILEIGHAEALVPMIQSAMARAGMQFADLERIVVTRGPGTFTGVRTGVAVARGLALATPAKLVGVSSLWAIGVAALARMRGQGGDCRGVLVAMDARKGMLYVQSIDSAGNERSEPMLADPDTIARAAFDQKLGVVGTGSAAVAAAALAHGLSLEIDQEAAANPSLQMPNASDLMAASNREPCQGPLQPLYLRAPDAKPQSGKALPWSPT
jgi:tRNA threonylcarbamoyl adenosine modification protein YeaZ